MKKQQESIHPDEPFLYGLLAEFDQPEPLVHAAQQMLDGGYQKLDAYTPFPVEGLSSALGFEKDRVPLLTLIGGITGGLSGYFMQWYANVIAYPIQIAGRPYHSWPAFIPITFELTILGAALSAAFGMLALNRLPQPFHPVFNHPSFVRASKDRFFLCIQSDDSLFHFEKTRQLLLTLEPLQVHEVRLEDDGSENS